MFTICSYTADEWTPGASMERATKQADIARLRAHIATIERRPALADKSAPSTAAAGLLATPPGLLHEVYTDDVRNSASLLGFAFGLSRSLLTQERPALIFAQLIHEGQETGLPYGAGLIALGFDPNALVFVRVTNLVELLWSLEEAISCKAVAGVIADVNGTPKVLDFTVSRRLSMRAQTGGASVFFLRYGHGREASASHMRWHIRPAPSRTLKFDPRALGGARYAVTLEKGRLAQEGTTFLLDWTNHGFQHVTVRTTEAHSAEALPGAALATLGNRLSQAR